MEENAKKFDEEKLIHYYAESVGQWSMADKACSGEVFSENRQCPDDKLSMLLERSYDATASKLRKRKKSCSRTCSIVTFVIQKATGVTKNA